MLLLLRFRVELDVDASTESILQTYSTRIRSLISLNFNLALPIELLIAALMGFQLFVEMSKELEHESHH